MSNTGNGANAAEARDAKKRREKSVHPRNSNGYAIASARRRVASRRVPTNYRFRYGDKLRQAGRARLPTRSLFPTDLQRAVLYAGTYSLTVLRAVIVARPPFRRDIATIKFRGAHLAPRERPIICAAVNPRGHPLLIARASVDAAQIRGRAISARETRANSISDRASLMTVPVYERRKASTQ